MTQNYNPNRDRDGKFATGSKTAPTPALVVQEAGTATLTEPDYNSLATKTLFTPPSKTGFDALCAEYDADPMETATIVNGPTTIRETHINHNDTNYRIVERRIQEEDGAITVTTTTQIPHSNHYGHYASIDDYPAHADYTQHPDGTIEHLSQRWYNQKGEPHRNNKPAIIINQPHLNKPIIEYYNNGNPTN